MENNLYTPLNKGVISSRTGKNTVALVGFSSSTRHLVPYEDKETEIWGINDAYRVQGFMERWDRWFQLHPPEYLAIQDNTPRDAEHLKWLREKHEFPIYMQKHYKDMPSSVKYPLEEVFRRIGRPYITSSFGFLFGLAMLEGFERIEIYGFDMKTFTEYAEQRPNTEYLIGKAEGEGIDVLVPPLCSLVKGPLYGYKSLEVSLRQEMEYIHSGMEEQVKQERNVFFQLDGKYETLKELVKKYPELEKDMKQARKDREKQVATINNYLGRVQMAEEMMILHDDVKQRELVLKETTNGNKTKKAS